MCASESVVCFATCTLPLDGGECLYIKNILNSKLGSRNRGFDKKLEMDLKTNSVHKIVENINLVISILPSVDENFQVGWAPLGQSRVLKFSFSSKGAMFLVQRWMSKVKLTKADTDIRITFNGCSYPQARMRPEMKLHFKAEPTSAQQPLVTMKGKCRSEALNGHAISAAYSADVTFPHNDSPIRTAVAAGARRVLPTTALAKRGGYPQRKAVAPLDDHEWAAELAKVRLRLDSVVALSRLRW